MGDYNADANPNLNKMRTVAFAMHLVSQDNLKVDQFSTVGTEKIYHYARKIMSTRIRFKVEPANVSG